MPDDDRIELVYDRECPVCDYYCNRVDVEAGHGKLVRVDARDMPDIMDEITALGLDIDEGMVVKRDGRIYYGADAIHELARMSSRQGFINRVAHLAFRSAGRSNFLYPILKALRNLLLKLLGRSRINNLNQSNNERF